MASIMNTAVPRQRKTQIIESSIDQSNDFLSDVVTVDSRDEESDLEQWISEFGLQSGTTFTLFFFALFHFRALTKTPSYTQVHGPQSVMNIYLLTLKSRTILILT